MKDEMTVSSSAQAIGKNVILKYVLRVKRDVSKQKLDEYRSELYQEIVPKACRVNSNNPAFKDACFIPLSMSVITGSHLQSLL